jgi:hypothetical protein
VCAEGGYVKTDSRHAAKRKVGGDIAIVEDAGDGDSEDDRPLAKKAAADTPPSERGGNIRAASSAMGADPEEDRDAGASRTQQTPSAGAAARDEHGTVSFDN